MMMMILKMMNNQNKSDIGGEQKDVTETNKVCVLKFLRHIKNPESPECTLKSTA